MITCREIDRRRIRTGESFPDCRSDRRISDEFHWQFPPDLAVQIELGVILGMDDRPTEKAIRALAEPWSPHRGAAAVFAWHHRRAGAPAV